MTSHTLTIVGTGIKFRAHMTLEAEAYILSADKVLYLLNEPAMAAWIEKKNANSESLEAIYFGSETRQMSYAKISDRISEILQETQNLCVVLYGHPTVFSAPALAAAKIAKEQGHDVCILPGISAQDCLFADLMIDPGDVGCLSYEATVLIEEKRVVDSRSHLIIWQPDCLFEFGHDKKAPQAQFKKLIAYLSQYYHLNHEVCIYEASQYPHIKHKAKYTLLKELTVDMLSPISTLYLKPIIVK